MAPEFLEVGEVLVLGGSLFDGVTGTLLEDSGIRIEHGRFTAVGRRADFGAVTHDQPVVDATGRFVLPGLIDMHLHVASSWFTGPPQQTLTAPAPQSTMRAERVVALSLAKGVTTARELGGAFDVPLYIRDAIARRDIPGPRLITCGRPISATGGHAWFFCRQADGPEEFRKAAREQLQAGADFVKCMTSHEPVPMPGVEKSRAEVTLAEMAAAFEVGHDWGRLACCHATCSTAISRALEAGVDLLEHGHYLTDELAEDMATRGVVLTPTLSCYDSQIMNNRVSFQEPWAIDYKVLIPGHQAAFAAALHAGVMMTVGTDTFGIYAEEVDLMRRMGMTAKDSLIACTATGAKALRMGTEIGTVEAGKVADLVILREDPLLNAYALDSVELVVKDGEVFRPSDLTYIDSRTNSPTMMELASREKTDA